MRGLLAFGALVLAGCGQGVERPASVLLVTFDTTRADRIGCYGRADAGTATIDAIAARGVRFERALTPVPITLPAHTSLLTASHPPYHGVRDNGTYVASSRLDSLAERLQAEGRRTAAFVSALPLEADFGLDQGFDHYDQNRAKDAAGEHMNERRAQDTVERALVWLEDVTDDESFFLWVHLFDPHFPYAAPGELDPRHDPYQAEIAYADRQFGRLITLLEERGRTDDTIVVMTSDHGESLGERGEISHGHLLYDGTQHVPLVMAGPGIQGGRVIEHEVSLVDVAPTVCEWLGIDAPEFRAHGGRSLFGLAQGAPEASLLNGALYMETLLPRLHSGWSELYGVEQGGWSWTIAPGAARGELMAVGGEPRAFAIDAEGLPAAPADGVEKARELGHLLAQLRAELPPDEPFESRVVDQADEAMIAGLEALGYTGVNHGTVASDEPGRDPREVIGARAAAEELRELIERQQLAAAADKLETIRALDPGGLLDAEFSGMLALAQSPPNHEAAQAAYDAATRLAPGRRNLWVQLAACQKALGDPAAALVSIERAKALAPPSERILSLEAILRRELGAD